MSFWVGLLLGIAIGVFIGVAVTAWNHGMSQSIDRRLKSRQEWD